MAVEDSLEKIDLFSEMPRKDLQRLAKVVVTRRYKKGEVIVKEGDLGIAFYAISKGSVEVFQGSPGHETVLAKTLEGGSFGDMALFDNQVRNASVRALEDCECLVLTKWDFNAELHAPGSRVASAMLPVLARRIRAANELAATH